MLVPSLRCVCARFARSVGVGLCVVFRFMFVIRVAHAVLQSAINGNTHLTYTAEALLAKIHSNSWHACDAIVKCILRMRRLAGDYSRLCPCSEGILSYSLTPTYVLL